MTEHQLTEHERKLLEDCPRWKLKDALNEAVGTDTMTISIDEWDDGDWIAIPSACTVTRGAYIPRPLVEQWLAERDAREAEIERRIGELVNCSQFIEHFLKYESEREMFNIDKNGLPWANAQACPDDIFVPRERIRAAIDAKRAADKAKEAEMTNTVLQCDGPYSCDRYSGCFRVSKLGQNGSIFCFDDNDLYTEPEARQLAEAEAARLNAKWREEQAAKQAEAEKQRRIALVAKFRYSQRTFWRLRKDHPQVSLSPNGDVSAIFRYGDIAIDSPELEAALRAAGVEEPVELSEELRARLETCLGIRAKELLREIGDGCRISPRGFILDFEGEPCTPAQARAFLREKGIEVKP